MVTLVEPEQRRRARDVVPYRYAHKLTPAEAGLLLEVRGGAPDRSGLMVQVQTASRRYGFTLNQMTSWTGLRHLMLVWDRPMEPWVLSWVRDRLGDSSDSIGDAHTASIAFTYRDRAASGWALPYIEDMKAATKNRLNVLRPDQETADGQLFVSNHKLVQTMVAETVRVRYQPAQLSDRLPLGVREQVLPFFVAASARIAGDRMWSRSSYDGCVAVRTAKGVVVTATQTRKAPLELGRLVLVHGYDEATNTVTYSGPALPSADCVEIMVLAGQRPDLHAFVHTHASRLVTRNPRFSGGLRIGVRVSGEPALGHELAALLPDRANNLVVLEEHGELFAGTSSGGAFFTWFDAVCDQARRALIHPAARR